MKRFACGLALGLPLLVGPLAAPARAGDKEAIAHYKEAVKHWSDPDPSAAVAAAEKALAEAQSKNIKMNVLVMLGQLHQGKTGDFGQALGYYEQVIRGNIGVEDNTLRSLKAQAFLGRGTIQYSEYDDIEKALASFQAAHNTYPTAQSADTLSQLCYRIGRDPTKGQDARAKQLEYAQKLAEEALHHDAQNRNKTANPARTAKYRLQLVITLLAQGKKEEGEAAWKETQQDALDVNAFYQLAILQTLRGEGAEVVGDTLRKCLEPEVRPKARARNQLRKFVRTEPDFKPFLEEEGWKDLVTDEPENG